MACIPKTSTLLLILMCAVSTIKISTALPIGADKVYVEESQDVLLPCLLNVQVSNIQSLYWQRITNTTVGFETLYSFSKFVQLGWQSPVKGHILNDTDLLLLKVSLNQSGTYLCKILTHSEARIIEKEIHLCVIRPLRKIEIRARGGNGTELIHNDDVIHLPSDKDFAFECSISGDVVPRASLSWVTSDGADVMDELNVTLKEYDGTDRMTAYINTSSIDGNGNVTCRAVQLVEGTPYVILQATIQIKRIGFVPEKYGRSNNSILLEGLGGTFMSIVFIVIAIIIIKIIRRKRKKGHRYENEIPVYIPAADELQTLMETEGVTPRSPQRAPDGFGSQDRILFLLSCSGGDMYECIPETDIVPDIDPCDYFRHGPGASGVSKALMEAYKDSNIKPGDVKRKVADLDHKIGIAHNTGDETYSQCSNDSFYSEC